MDSKKISDLLGTVDTSTLVDKVEIKLVDYFRKNNLQPGDQIPKEIELSKLMGVSRTVIREALIRLKTRGIIESRKHIGTIIKSPDLSIILEQSMIPNILDNSTLKDIFELRLTLEIGMADFIFQNITNEDIKQLDEIIRKEPKSSKKFLFDIDHEIAFHGKLYEITKNNTLISFQNILLTVFKYMYDAGMITKPIKVNKFVSHKQLVEILKSGHADQFRNAMRLHLDNHFERIKD